MGHSVCLCVCLLCDAVAREREGEMSACACVVLCALCGVEGGEETEAPVCVMVRGVWYGRGRSVCWCGTEWEVEGRDARVALVQFFTCNVGAWACGSW